MGGRVHPKHRKGSHKNSSKMPSKRQRNSSKTQRSSASASRSPSSLSNNMSDNEDNDGLRAELAASKRKVKELEEATEEEEVAKDPATAVIKKALKIHVWREAKFISTKGQLVRLSKKVLKYVAPKDMKAAEVDPWVEAHMKTVSRELNSHRSYVVQRIKDVCMDWMGLHGKDSLPSEAEIMNILARKKVNLDIFRWWWDEILPAAVGTAKQWSPTTRYYQTISNSRVADNPEQPLEVPCNTEAFAAFEYINNLEKWPLMFELKVDSRSLNIVKNAESLKIKNPKNLDVFTAEHPKLIPKYTASNVGQAPFGGTTTAGLEKFVEYRQINKIARKTKQSEKYEDQVLKALRAAHGIELDDHEAHRKSLGYGKKKSVAEPTEVAGLYSSASEVEKDNDGDGSDDDDEE